MNKNLIPLHYPQTSNSGIYDAQAFSVGKSDTVHMPEHYPNGLMVVAKCGVYGWTAENDGHRLAEWRDSLPTCERCKNV